MPGRSERRAGCRGRGYAREGGKSAADGQSGFFLFALKSRTGEGFRSFFLHAAATQPARKEKSRCPRGSSYRPAPAPRGAKRGHRSEAAPHKGAEPTPRRSGRAPPRNGAAAGRASGQPAGARPEGTQTLPESRPAPKKPPAKRGVQGGFQIKSRPARAAFHSTPPRRGGASADRGQPGQETPRLLAPLRSRW